MNDGLLPEVQWRVIWFPPEGDKVFTGSEARVRGKASEPDVSDWNPIIESREVGPWRMV